MKTLVLALIAGSCCSAGALGQVLKPMGEGHTGPIYKIDKAGNIVGELSPFEARDVGYTYRNDLFDSAGFWAPLEANTRHMLEDISFTPGPWSNVATSYSVSRILLSLYHVSAAQAPAQVQYRFWNAADCNFLGFTGTGTSMINPAATAVFTLTINLPATGLPANTGVGFNPVDFAPFTLPAGNYFVEGRILDPTTGNDIGQDIWRLPLCTGSHAPQVGTTPGNPCTIGSTGASLGVDGNNDGTFTGSPAAGTGENRAVGFNTSGQFWNVGMDLTLGGNIVTTAPSCQSLPLGVDNAFATDAAAYTATGVKWYCVTLGSNADDNGLKYIDLDTEGSAVDAAIGLYTAGGSLITKDDNSGSGTNAQLSFGIGRRAAVGDGLQYDGRNYDTTNATSVGLAPGTYFVAVAPSGAGAGATFADGYSAVGNGTAGNITLRVRTNVAGGALDPSVAPVATRIIGLGGEDPIVGPGGQISPVALNGPGVLWYDVNLCNAADASNPVTFDLTGTTAQVSSVTVFDSLGNEVGQAAGGTAPAVLGFGGSNPALPAGHYYIAMTYDPTPNLAPSPTNAGRWHVRAKNGSQGYNFSLAVAVPWNSCAPACGTADFNCDGDVGTDADINAFFACLSGVCPSLPCTNGADFNGDGDVGTDADIEAFFRVLGGGTC